MKYENTILFDPGYAPLVIDSIGQVGYTYYMFSAVPDVKLKRLNFLHVFNKLQKLLKTNISFYLGCLMWASYIKKFDNYKIEGNKLFGEDCKEEEYTGEIDFLIDFIENQMPRDCKYYQNRKYIPDEKYLPVLKTYREFLVLNNGFVKCENTNQIVLPKNIKDLTDIEKEKINEKIQLALSNKNIDELLESYNLLMD